MSSLPQRLIELGSECTDLSSFRQLALRTTREALDAHVGLLITLGPQQGISFDGLSAVEHVLTLGWQDYGEEITPVVKGAIQQGVTTDYRSFGQTLWKSRLYRQVMAPLGGTESMIVVMKFRTQKIGMLMLGKCGGYFSDASLDLARELSPSVALGVIAQSKATQAHAPASRPLSDTDRELLDYLALGYSTKDIAVARGKSFFTVRNQLHSLFQKLGVSNRTEAVGLYRSMQ